MEEESHFNKDIQERRHAAGEVSVVALNTGSMGKVSCAFRCTINVFPLRLNGKPIL
jgi:hypothetical protein